MPARGLSLTLYDIACIIPPCGHQISTGQSWDLNSGLSGSLLPSVFWLLPTKAMTRRW